MKQTREEIIFEIIGKLTDLRDLFEDAIEMGIPVHKTKQITNQALKQYEFLLGDWLPILDESNYKDIATYVDFLRKETRVKFTTHQDNLPLKK